MSLLLIALLILIGDCQASFLSDYKWGTCGTNIALACLILDPQGHEFQDLKQIRAAYAEGNYEQVIVLTQKTIDQFYEKAKLEQASAPPEDSFADFRMDGTSLNRVGMALYIQGRAYLRINQYEKAQEVFGRLSKEFNLARCFQGAEIACKNCSPAYTQTFYLTRDYPEMRYGILNESAMDPQGLILLRKAQMYMSHHEMDKARDIYTLIEKEFISECINSQRRANCAGFGLVVNEARSGLSDIESLSCSGLNPFR